MKGSDAISVKKYVSKYIQSPVISVTFICFNFSFSVSFLITFNLSHFNAVHTHCRPGKDAVDNHAADFSFCGRGCQKV